jgi:hypothetical protein
MLGEAAGLYSDDVGSYQGGGLPVPEKRPCNTT